MLVNLNTIYQFMNGKFDYQTIQKWGPKDPVYQTDQLFYSNQFWSIIILKLYLLGRWQNLSWLTNTIFFWKLKNLLGWVFLFVFCNNLFCLTDKKTKLDFASKWDHLNWRHASSERGVCTFVTLCLKG